MLRPEFRRNVVFIIFYQRFTAKRQFVALLAGTVAFCQLIRIIAQKIDLMSGICRRIMTNDGVNSRTIYISVILIFDYVKS